MIMVNVGLEDSVQKLGFPLGIVDELKKNEASTVEDLVNKDADGLFDSSFILKNYLSRFFVIRAGDSKKDIKRRRNN